MRKFMYKCKTCSTLMSIETEIDPERINMSPACVCGKDLMLSLSSYEYAYGLMQYPQQRRRWDE